MFKDTEPKYFYDVCTDNHTDWSQDKLDKYINMYHRDFIVDSVLLTVCFLLLFGMLWILYKVYSIIKFKNLPIILMLLFMILSVVALINFFYFEGYYNKVCWENILGEHEDMSKSA